jgi:hypothetical protein
LFLESVLKNPSALKLSANENKNVELLTVKNNSLHFSSGNSNLTEAGVLDSEKGGSKVVDAPGWLLDYRKRFSQKAILPYTIELSDRFIIVKKVRLTGTEPTFIAKSFFKTPYHEWLKSETALVKVVPITNSEESK